SQIMKTRNSVIIILVLLVVVFTMSYIAKKVRPLPPEGPIDFHGPSNYPPLSDIDTNEQHEPWNFYSFGGTRITYPPDWLLEEVKYRTPAMEENDEDPQVVGYTLTRTGDKNKANAILLGGRQTDCKSEIMLSQTKAYCFTGNGVE